MVRRIPKTELSIVFKEGVGPGRPASVLVDGIRRGGQVAAVDGGTAGGVGDDRPVAEELAEQLDVGGFATASAGAGELEQRAQQLRMI